jgi:alpha-mannosidase
MDMIEKIQPFVVADTCDLTKWETRTGVYTAPGTYRYDSEQWSEISLGTTWDCTYDVTRWFRIDVAIPERFRGRKVLLEIDFGGEVQARIDGVEVGAFSSNMNEGWVHRDQILISKSAGAGSRFSLELECTINSGGYCDVFLAGEDKTTYTMAKGRLVAIDEVAESYHFDVTTAFHGMECIRDKTIKALVFKAIDASLDCLDFDFDRERFLESIPGAQEQLHTLLASIPHAPPAKVIMTGHSHIDTAWLWTVRESVRKCGRTFSNVIALMDWHKETVFAQSQAALYDFTKTHFPKVYRRIKDRVQDGKWEIVGNVWVEADTNIPTGESLVRQLLYGREYFLKEFGVTSEIYWLPDCFGFSWALPQIIRRSGMRHFITAKLNNQDTNRFPHSLFTWQGNDGSTITAYIMREAYNGEYTPEYIDRIWNDFDQKENLQTVLGMYGYGDGGGGPTYGMIERGKRLKAFPGLPASEIGRAEDFFRETDTCRDDLPVWNDEMYYENHRGTYTSQARTKRNNRKGEFLLRNTEMASTMATAECGFEYPAAGLESAWKTLLLNQFHDILPGTSIPAVFEDCDADYASLFKLSRRLWHSAMAAFSDGARTDANDIVVWNFLSWEVSSIAKIGVDGRNAVSVVDTMGNTVPSSVSTQNGRSELVFLATVPSMGYSIYRMQAAPPEDAEVVVATPDRLENTHLRITLDTDGLITSIWDKESKREVITQGEKGNLLQVFRDTPGHESSWNLQLHYQHKFWNLDSAVSIEVVESSATQGVIRVVRQYNKSTITQDIKLVRNSRRIDFETRVDWQEREKLLKASFPVEVRSSKAAYEIQYGAIDRPTHWNTSRDRAKFEVCGHKWADLSEGDYGVSLLNDCKYGYDIKDSRMRISLLKAPIVPDPNADIGDQEFVYSLYPHRGTWQSADTVAQGFELNSPLHAYLPGKHTGSAERQRSFVEIDQKTVVVDCLKRAQDGDGIILRVYESAACRCATGVTLAFDVVGVTECNLMEEHEADVEVSNKNSFEFFIKPYEVRTFRIRLAVRN